MTPRVTIQTATPRDRHTPTIRLVPMLAFPGMPIPGMPVDLIMPGTARPVPGYVHSFDAFAGVVRVAPDYQTILKRPGPTAHGWTPLTLSTTRP